MERALILALSLLALTGFVSGFEEIESQKVAFNDNIRQFAIVRVVEGDVAYNKYCEDCNAYITLKDQYGRTIVDNETMLNLSVGLFGYKAVGTSLKANILYSMEVLTTSETYGSGTVYSVVELTEASNFGVSASSVSSTGIVEDINNFLDGNPGNEDSLGNNIWEYFLGLEPLNPETGEPEKGTITYAIEKGSNMASGVTEAITDAGSTVVDISSGIMGFVVDMTSASTRQRGLDRAFAFWFEVVKGIMMVFFPFFILMEFFIIQSAMASDSMFEKYISLHIDYYFKFFQILNSVFGVIFNAISSIANILTGMASALLPW